jgi:hypothetical protein
MDDRERQKLIEKLRTAKTNEERDQILRDLANQDKAAPGQSQGAEATGVVKPAAKEPEGKKQASMAPGWRSVRVKVTVIVILFLVAAGIMKIMEGQSWDSAAGKAVVMGCALLFAVALQFLNRKLLAERGRGQGPVDGEVASGETAGQTQERVAPGVRVVIILMMVFCGLSMIVTSVMKIMQGEWGYFEISELIVGCAFLFAAIFIFFKERAKEKAGRETEKRSPPPTISD